MTNRKTVTLNPFNPKDVASFREIASKTDTPEMHEAFGMFLYSSENEATLPEAIYHLSIASDAGQMEARGYLGSAYIKGLGVSRNVDKGIALCRESAEMGSLESMFTLGLEYLYGWNIDCDYDLAYDYLKKASDQGYDRAINGLGFMYLCGLHVDKDMGEAKRLFKASAAKGNRNAKNNLRLVAKCGPDYDYLAMIKSEGMTKDYNWEYSKRHS